MRAALYARVSTPRQAEAGTMEQQVSRLQEYVAEQGWVLDPEHIYRDDGYSGAKLDRPGLDRLRDRAAFNEFDVVVILTPDRLTRNFVHQMVVMEELQRRHIAVQFVDRPVSDDPHDRLLLQIRGAVAEYERTLIADRMRRGRLMKYQTGQRLPWSRVPYGYRADPACLCDPKGVTLDEAEASMVRQMFAWYLEPGATVYGVTRQLMNLGLPTPLGKVRWWTSTVRGILGNTAYRGVVYANRERTVTPRQRQSPLRPVGLRGQTTMLRPEEEWIPIEVPAIVDPETFERVQAKLARNQQSASRNNKAHQYLLRGLLSCGMCRSSAHGRTNGKYQYYLCSGRTDGLRAPEERCTPRHIRTQQLDDLVWQDLCDVLTPPDIIAQALERAHGGHWLPHELTARIQGLARAEQQLERQKQRLLEAYLAEVISLEELERKRTHLDQKEAAIYLQRTQLEASAAERLQLAQIAASIEAFCAQIRPVLAQATFEQKRQLVELLIDRVIVTDDQVEIRYVLPTSPDSPHIPFGQLRADYQIAGPHFVSVVLDEGGPGLFGLPGREVFPGLTHIFRHRAFTDLVTQLAQFISNPFGAPQPIINSHSLNQSQRFRINPGLACPACFGFQFPEQVQALPMPLQQGVWFDDDEGFFPALYLAGQEDQAQAIVLGQLGTFDLTVEHNQLLAQQGILSHQFALTADQIKGCSDCQSFIIRFGLRFEPVIEMVNHSPDNLDEDIKQWGEEFQVQPFVR